MIVNPLIFSSASLQETLGKQKPPCGEAKASRGAAAKGPRGGGAKASRGGGGGAKASRGGGGAKASRGRGAKGSRGGSQQNYEMIDFESGTGQLFANPSDAEIIEPTVKRRRGRTRKTNVPVIVLAPTTQSDVLPISVSSILHHTSANSIDDHQSPIRLSADPFDIGIFLQGCSDAASFKEEEEPHLFDQLNDINTNVSDIFANDGDNNKNFTEIQPGSPLLFDHLMDFNPGFQQEPPVLTLPSAFNSTVSQPPSSQLDAAKLDISNISIPPIVPLQLLPSSATQSSTTSTIPPVTLPQPTFQSNTTNIIPPAISPFSNFQLLPQQQDSPTFSAFTSNTDDDKFRASIDLLFM